MTVARDHAHTATAATRSLDSSVLPPSAAPTCEPCPLCFAMDCDCDAAGFFEILTEQEVRHENV